MKKYFLVIPSIFLVNLLIGCTASQQNSENEKQIYIFDEVPEEKTIETPTPEASPTITSTYYIVQIGAYTNEDKAQALAEIARTKTNYKYSVVYSENLKLFLVQIIPLYKSRIEAEEVRKNLWKLTEFVDAWIVTVNK